MVDVSGRAAENLDALSRRSILVKIIEHRDIPREEKSVKSQFIGDLELVLVSEAQPVVSQRESVLGPSSRPERADTVVRVVTADPSLSAASDERVIKRQRLGNTVLEQITGPNSA